MAQQTTADDSTELENDPELLVADLGDAAKSLQIHMTRDEMRQACRDWDVEGYSSPGTKAYMAEQMLEQAEERALAHLAEEGVEITGDLVDDEDDEAEQDQEQEDEDRQTVADVLMRDPDEHYNDSALTGTEKQTAALRAAFEDLERTEDEAAEVAGCTGRYVYDTCARFDPEAEDYSHLPEDLDVPQEVQA